MQAIGLAHLLLNQHRERFELFLKARRDLDSFGHILDPTLFRDVTSSRSVAQQVRMAETAMKFLRDVDEVVQEVVRQAGDVR